MKGVVFTEFLGFVADQFGHDKVDDIIIASGVPSGGAYTSVGTYDHREMQSLVVALADSSGLTATDLLRQFGHHLCKRFSQSHPSFFSRSPGLFEFLESVQEHIHVEVKKLYPDAELPSLNVNARSDSAMELDYQSCRPLAALAEGLILGAADYFNEPVNVAQRAVERDTGPAVRLAISRTSGNAVQA